MRVTRFADSKNKRHTPGKPRKIAMLARTKRNDMHKAFLTAFCVGISSIGTLSPARAGSIIAPDGYQSTAGNDVGRINVVQRFLEVIDASQFSTLTSPVLITAITYRPSPSQASPATQTVDGLLYLSTAQRQASDLSPVFTDDVGRDSTLVASGTKTLTTENLPGPGDTKAFDIVVTFSTPFLYNPANGGLALDFWFLNFSAPSIALDAVQDDPAVGTVFASPPDAPSGEVSSRFGDIVQFTFQTVPEPSSVTLLSISGLAFGVGYKLWRPKAA
jgi:hypothetical protein